MTRQQIRRLEKKIFTVGLVHNRMPKILFEVGAKYYNYAHDCDQDREYKLSEFEGLDFKPLIIPGIPKEQADNRWIAGYPADVR